MLVLKINTYNHFGENHPEGYQKEEKYFPIDKNMTVEEFEKFINLKTICTQYVTKTFKLIKIEEME